MCARLLCLPLFFGVATEAAAQTTPVVTITAGSTVTEGIVAVFNFSASPAPSGSLLVHYNKQNANSSAFTNPSILGDSAVFLHPIAGASIDLSTVNDSVDEPDGGIVLTILNRDGYTVGTPSSATVMVMDDDPTIVSLARVGSGAVAEGSYRDTVEFTVTLGRELIAGEIIDVPLSIGGTGVTTSDWSLVKKSGETNTGVTLRDTNTATPKVRFSGAGAQTATLELTATEDDTPESGGETFEIALGADSAFDDSNLGTNVGGGADPHGTDNSFQVRNTDTVMLRRPHGTLHVSGFPKLITEGSLADRPAYKHQTVPLSVKRLAWAGGWSADYDMCFSGTATADTSGQANLNQWDAGADYQIRRGGNPVTGNCITGLKIPRGAHHPDRSDVVTIKLRSDNTVEPDESVVMTVTETSGNLHGSTVTAYITDDDRRVFENHFAPNPAVTLMAGSTGVNEGSPVPFTVRLEHDRATARYVYIGLYGPPGAPLPGWSAGASAPMYHYNAYLVSNGTMTMYVDHTEDKVSQARGYFDYCIWVWPDKNYTVKGNGGRKPERDYDGERANCPSGVTVRVWDNDPTPRQADEQGASVVPTEAISNLQVAAVDAASASVTWDAVPHATSYEVAWDVESGETSLAGILPSLTGTSATIQHSAEEPMTLTVMVTPEYVDGNGVTQQLGGLAATATLTVGPGGTESDSQSDSIQPGSVQSSDSQAAACVSDALRADVQGYAGETWRTSPDHVERWSRVLAAFGDSNAYSNNPMTLAEAQAQADRGLQRWVPVVPALECLAAAPQEKEEEKEEEEAQPATLATPELSLSAGSAVAEGGNASFTLTADPAPQSDLTIAYTVAQSGDYLDTPGAGSRTVTLAAGTASLTFSVATVDDAAAEADGSVSVTLGTGTGYTVATGKGSAAVTVQDNDEPVVSITAGSGVTEGTAAFFTVTTSPTPAAPLDVTLTVVRSGEVAASDEPGSRTVTVPVTGSLTVEVPTVDDGVDEPDGAITATVTAGTGYMVAAAPDNGATVVVSDNDAASSGPIISIADANFKENERHGYFTVTLSEKMDHDVRFAYATRDSTPVSATANADYVEIPRAWTIGRRIKAGTTQAQLSIRIRNDSHDEDPETFQVEIFDAFMYRSGKKVPVSIADGVAVGTIINSDPMPAAWLGRFGRTVSHQVVEVIQDRFTATTQAGLTLTVAGEELTSATPLAENQQVLAKVLGFETVTAQQAVEGSAFSFSPSADGHPLRFAIWGQGALSSFSGAEDNVSLDGDVTTALLGAEWSGARWQAGAALSHSWGSGGYAGDNTDTTEDTIVADGDITTTLTGIFPYGRYGLTPRLGIWATAGYGWGDLTLKPDGDGTDYSPGITMTMGAVGMDGLLLDGGAEGLSLTSTADALLVKTTSEAVAGLASSEANISRLRLGLEATRPVPLANGASLLPSLELGIRQDGGDAETGFGMELGAGLAWTDPERGISAALKGRTLLTHADEEFREQGLAVSFAWEPNPSNRGPSLALSHAVGAVAEGGMDALLSPTTMELLDATPSRHHQFETKLAYGFPAFNDRLTLTPGVGLALSPDSRTYSLLWALAPYAQQSQAEPWEISLEGERQEGNTAESAVEHSLKLRFSVPF